MITAKDRQIIEEMAAKYGAKRVVLFGSSLAPDRESRDIDIGVEGIGRFVELVKREGVPLYA